MRKTTKNLVTGHKEHTVSIFRAEVRRVCKCMVYIGLGGGSGQEDGMRRGDGAMFWPIGKNTFQGSKEKGWIRKEKQDRKLQRRMTIQARSTEFDPY
jgi:hypothetical protein